jgi:hypothetical protein
MNFRFQMFLLFLDQRDEGIKQKCFVIDTGHLHICRYITVVVNTLYPFFGWCLNFYHTVDEKCIYLNRESYKINNIFFLKIK